MQAVQEEIARLINILKKDQQPDGSWDYPFETGVITDAYTIILVKILQIERDDLIRSLVDRLESRQEENGAWKLFADEKDGNLSLTIESYYALLFSGYRSKKDPHMERARRFILSKGGLSKASMYTKFMLALTGQYQWPPFFPIPIEVVLLPPSSLVSIYDLSVFGRSNLIPLLLLANKKYMVKNQHTPSLQDLKAKSQRIEEDWEELRSDRLQKLVPKILQNVKNLIGLPSYLHSFAIEAIKRYMLGRIEADGTLYSYFSSTFYMIFALLSLGYSKKDPVIAKAVEGIMAMETKIKEKKHIQYTTANVWNTGLISYTLQEAGIPLEDETVHKANSYLLSRQHYKFGDWIYHNPHTTPGGWGFSDTNTINPDVDDTTAALRAIHRYIPYVPQLHEVWSRGLNYTISMQNDDGGFPAFERNIDKSILHLLPIEGPQYILTDPSTPDLTGRTLEFLGKYANLKLPDKKIKRAVRQLLGEQRKDGSWYGRWGICYIYGTWAALTGLHAAGLASDHPSIVKAARWLKNIQKEDGGWGESCYSDINEKYIPLNKSTLTQTAWALDALISISDETSPIIEKGIKYLIENIKEDSWTNDYPIGQGMSSFFYIHYHSYRYIFPLLSLSHYKSKFM
ncbi:squalene--hopene cyclase [Peribacillus sp. SCS-155]|uniref:squalene--hopene cyclase n=1 Tax=Peribacillus sedimenti TaxID=3115297 RepID=UPI0039064825